jgi:hypothetical protein
VAKQLKEMLPKSAIYIFSAYEVGKIRDLQTLKSLADGVIQKSNLKTELNAMVIKELERRVQSY